MVNALTFDVFPDHEIALNICQRLSWASAGKRDFVTCRKYVHIDWFVEINAIENKMLRKCFSFPQARGTECLQ